MRDIIDIVNEGWVKNALSGFLERKGAKWLNSLLDSIRLTADNIRRARLCVDSGRDYTGKLARLAADGEQLMDDMINHANYLLDKYIEDPQVKAEWRRKFSAAVEDIYRGSRH